MMVTRYMENSCLLSNRFTTLNPSLTSPLQQTSPYCHHTLMYQVVLKWTIWTAPKSMHTPKIHSLSMGGAYHDGSIHCMLAPPLLMSANNSWFCSTHNCSSPLLYIAI